MKYYSADQIKKNELGRACSTYGGKEHTWFSWGNLRKGDNLEDPNVDGRIILKCTFEKRDGAQDGAVHQMLCASKYFYFRSRCRAV